MRDFVSRQRWRLAWLVRPRRTVAIAGFDVHMQRWGDVENADVVERDELTRATSAALDVFLAQPWVRQR